MEVDVNLSRALLKAPHIGVRNLRSQMSKSMKSGSPLVVTEHGQPSRVLVSYSDMIELADILDELRDTGMLRRVAAARTLIRKGSAGIPVSGLIRRIRLGSKRRAA